MTERVPDAQAVAVIGMAGRFPGARDVEELWHNLCRGVESIRRLTPEEMRAAGVDPALLADPRQVPAAGVLDGADLFDAAFFQITPREAELLDPQHRVFLECAWEALEDAGCDPARFPGAIGAFAGASLNTYLLHNLLPGGESIANPQVAIASDKDFLTTRLSYKLDLRGPSLDVQTGCSTSLVAVVLACQSLLGYQCDLALAGGVAVREPQRAGYLYQENGILSPDGHCRPFDARAAGTVPGHGVGVVVLKRLEEALADGDTIRAVILGAALNNDGAAKVGFTAPGVAGQAEAVATALGVAGVRPEDVSFIEAHGTATPMGDPIEVRALDRVFRTGSGRTSFCALGSIKSNLGHLDAAAGVAGLIKTVLALEHRQIPPTLHFTAPHPDAGLEDGPFFVNAELRSWETDALPRRAGVSSFGIGGTNAHVVLEEAPPPALRPPADDGPELLVLSARTATALEAATGRLARHLESHPALALRDAAHTLRLGRRPMEVRRTVVVRDRADAAAALASPERWLTATRPTGDVQVAFLFPGQGAQHAGMAAGLYEDEPAFRKALDACREVLEPELGIDLRALLDPATPAERLNATEVTQPVLFAVEYALARLWQSWGVQPAAFLGHSLGEYAAACLAGVFPLAAALRLVSLRGRMMQSLPPGAMLSVSLSEDDLRPLLDSESEIAAVNAPDRTVAAGPPEAVEGLRRRLADRGVEARPLPVERAFHTRAVEPVIGAFVDEVRRASPAPPQIPYLSNLTGTWVTAEQATDPASWGEHLRRPVRFADEVRELLREPGWVLLEVGPGQTLASLARLARRDLTPRPPLPSPPRPPGEGAPPPISSLPARGDSTPPYEALLGALGRLWLAGVEIDWNGLRTGSRKVPLPTYPFERQRFWIEPNRQEAPAVPAGPRLRTPLWRQSLPASRRPLAAEGAVWLVFPDAGGVGAQLLQRLQAERLEPVAVVPGPGFFRISTNSYALHPGSAADYDTLLDAVLTPGRPLRIVHLGGLGGDDEGLVHLAAAIRRREDPSPPAPSPAHLPTPGRGGEQHGLGGGAAPEGQGHLAQGFNPGSGGAAHAHPAAATAVRLDVITAGTLDPTATAPPAPGKTSLLGLCRGLTASGIPCRLVDMVPLPPGTPSEGREMKRLIDQIQAEIAADPSDAADTVIAWRGRHRWVEVWEELPPAAGPSKTEGAWLVAGDAPDPARGLAQLLAARGARVTVTAPADSPWEDLNAAMEEISSRAVAPLSRSGREGGGRAGEGTGEGAADRLAAATGALCTSYVLTAFRSRGIEPAPGAVLSLPELRRRLSLAPGQERLLQALLRILRDDGIAEVLGGEEIRFLRAAAGVPAPAEARRAGEAQAPELRGLFDLLDHCGRNLAGVLSGEVPGLSVLYPGGSSEALARAVRAAEAEGLQDAAPLLLREVLSKVLEGRKGQQGQQGRGAWPDRPLRILEVGAGQGTLTRELVPVLGEGVEYWFTDVGRSFVLAAEERAAGSRSMRFKVLDITRDPAGQGFPLGFFDAVLGANVVHATPSIEETLGRLRSLLAPGGLLGLLETVRRQRWADLVWGLTEGWWSFSDAPLRTESPLLSAAAWQDVLGRAGFAAAQAWPRGDVETALLLAVRGADVSGDGIGDGIGGAAAGQPGVYTPGYVPSPSGRHPHPAIVFLTRNPSSLPSLAAQAEDHTRRTDTFATAILLEGWEGGPGGAEAHSPGREPREGPRAEALAQALDRALAGNLAQIAVSAGPGVSIPEPAADPSPILQASQSPSSLHGRPQLMTAYVAPRTEEEQAIAEIWQKALGIDRVGVNDNFLELGGDSLIGLQVVYAVQSRFSLAGRTLNLYEHSTVAAAARFVAAGTGEAADDPFVLRSSRGEQRRERRGSFKRMKP